MYVRKKKNRSGSTSVVVVSKKSGRYEEVKSFGASTNPEEISRLYRQAKEWAHPKCGRLEIVFYDVTSLYFETSVTDTLREPGFSKDGRMAESQVVLGLLVSEGGCPLSYSLYNGKQHEGFTMIPMIDDFKARFSLADDFVIVADSGLMSRKNVDLLRQGGYKYIIGARIRNTTGQVKDWILSPTDG